MMGLPELYSMGKAIMGAVRQGKSVWHLCIFVPTQL